MANCRKCDREISLFSFHDTCRECREAEKSYKAMRDRILEERRSCNHDFIFTGGGDSVCRKCGYTKPSGIVPDGGEPGGW